MAETIQSNQSQFTGGMKRTKVHQVSHGYVGNDLANDQQKTKKFIDRYLKWKKRTLKTFAKITR